MTKSQTKAALATVRSELADLRAQHAAAQGRMHEIDAEITTLREAPVAMGDMLPLFGRWVADRGARYAATLRLFTMDTQRGSDLAGPVSSVSWKTLEQHGIGPFLSESRALRYSEDAMGALCFFVPDLVTKKLQEQVAIELKAMAKDDDAMPVAQRKARIDELSAERARIEAEAAGLIAQINDITGALALK